MKRSARICSSTESNRRHASTAPGVSMLSINPTNSSIPSSAINWAHSVRRRPNPALTERSTEQEATRRTASSGPPGQILVDCWPVYRRKLVRDPNPTGERPKSKMKCEDPCGVRAAESSLLLLGLLPATQRRKTGIDVLQGGLKFFLLARQQLLQGLAVLVAERGAFGKFDETHNDTPPVENISPNQKAE